MQPKPAKLFDGYSVEDGMPKPPKSLLLLLFQTFRMLHAADPDYQYLLDTYTRARNKYKPRHLQCILLAEAPPCNLDRFFYFEEVKKQDSLFLEIMGVLYPDEKEGYLRSGRDAERKAALLEQFAEDGYWLLDVWEVPGDFAPELERQVLPNLLGRLKKYADKHTPIILIKTNVYDLCYGPLKEAGYNVIDERMPFPGSGQQKVFREKFARAVSRVG